MCRNCYELGGKDCCVRKDAIDDGMLSVVAGRVVCVFGCVYDGNEGWTLLFTYM